MFHPACITGAAGFITCDVDSVRHITIWECVGLG